MNDPCCTPIRERRFNAYISESCIYDIWPITGQESFPFHLFFQPAASDPVYEDESNHGVHSTISHEVYSPIFTTAIPTIDCCLMLLKHWSCHDHYMNNFLVMMMIEIYSLDLSSFDAAA